MGMDQKKIAIIGGGNLGSAITEGLVFSKLFPNENITITRRKIHLLENFRAKGLNVTGDNAQAVKDADIILLAVKPYQILDILTEIKPFLTPDKIMVSMVAGISFQTIEKETGDSVKLFRAMPNTAIAICESMTCLSYPKKSENCKDDVLELFNHLGKTTVINEELMSAATVLGACGIAFALRYLRASMQGGIEIGFSAEVAQFITAQTVRGAAELILNSDHHPEQEIDKVTTPRGVTISGLNEMEHKGFSSALIHGLVTSYRKIEHDNK
jgi:pyrroline-5-carboxylate reductase